MTKDNKYIVAIMLPFLELFSAGITGENPQGLAVIWELIPNHHVGVLSLTSCFFGSKLTWE